MARRSLPRPPSTGGHANRIDLPSLRQARFQHSRHLPDDDVSDGREDERAQHPVRARLGDRRRGRGGSQLVQPGLGRVAESGDGAENSSPLGSLEKLGDPIRERGAGGGGCVTGCCDLVQKPVPGAGARRGAEPAGIEPPGRNGAETSARKRGGRPAISATCSARCDRVEPARLFTIPALRRESLPSSDRLGRP